MLAGRFLAAVTLVRLAGLLVIPACKARPVKAVWGMATRRPPLCGAPCFGFKIWRLQSVTAGGQFCRRPMRAAFRRRSQGGVLWDCFFLVMDAQKKIAQRPAGQPHKQQPDADLDAGAYNHISRRRQSPSRSKPRQRIRLTDHVASPCSSGSEQLPRRMMCKSGCALRVAAQLAQRLHAGHCRRNVQCFDRADRTMRPLRKKVSRKRADPIDSEGDLSHFL